MVILICSIFYDCTVLASILSPYSIQCHFISLKILIQNYIIQNYESNDIYMNIIQGIDHFPWQRTSMSNHRGDIAATFSLLFIWIRRERLCFVFLNKPILRSLASLKPAYSTWAMHTFSWQYRKTIVPPVYMRLSCDT